MIVILCTVFYLLTQNGTFFHGSITYHHTFISKNSDLTVESARYQLKRDSSIYLLSGDEYKMIQYYDGEVSATITYDEATRFVYEDLAERDYIVYHDSRKPNSLHFPQQIFRESIINVAGYECYMAKITSSFENSTFFYSDLVRINPDVYAD